MSDEIIQGLEAQLRDLATAFRGVLEWKWDARFKTALAEFEADMNDQVLGILGQWLTTTWDSSNIKDAPDAVLQVKKNLGGLMPEQMLLASDAANAVRLYCACGRGAMDRRSPSVWRHLAKGWLPKMQQH